VTVHVRAPNLLREEKTMSIHVIKSDVPGRLQTIQASSNELVFATGRLLTISRQACAGSTQATEFSVLRLGYQAADGLHFEKHGEDF
jgi:hypothetical protein